MWSICCSLPYGKIVLIGFVAEILRASFMKTVALPRENSNETLVLLAA